MENCTTLRKVKLGENDVDILLHDFDVDICHFFQPAMAKGSARTDNSCFTDMRKSKKQAGAELCQAQEKLWPS